MKGNREEDREQKGSWQDVEGSREKGYLGLLVESKEKRAKEKFAGSETRGTTNNNKKHSEKITSCIYAYAL